MASSSTQPARAERPDPESWLDRHGDFLFAFAMLRLRDPVLAEDAVQETLLAALQGWERFGGKSAERTWLAGILKHKITDQFRRARRETPTDMAEEEAFEHPEFFRDSGEWVGHWKPDLAPVDWTIAIQGGRHDRPRADQADGSGRPLALLPQPPVRKRRCDCQRHRCNTAALLSAALQRPDLYAVRQRHTRRRLAAPSAHRRARHQCCHSA